MPRAPTAENTISSKVVDVRSIALPARTTNANASSARRRAWENRGCAADGVLMGADSIPALGARDRKLTRADIPCLIGSARNQWNDVPYTGIPFPRRQFLRGSR